MPDETPLIVALDRARSLQGRFVHDLARDVGFNPTGKDKGWYGKLIESLVRDPTTELEQGNLHDLSSAGVEVKSFGLGRAGIATQAWEDLRLREINYSHLGQQAWHQSPLVKKLRATLMVPYWYPPLRNQKCNPKAACRNVQCDCSSGCTCSPWCPCWAQTKKDQSFSDAAFVLPAFLWVPNQAFLEQAAADYEAHRKTLLAGGPDPFGNLPESFGAILRAGTHSSTKAKGQTTYKIGDVAYPAHKRAWMMRKSTLDSICRANMRWPWAKAFHAPVDSADSED